MVISNLVGHFTLIYWGHCRKIRDWNHHHVEHNLFFCQPGNFAIVTFFWDGEWKRDQFQWLFSRDKPNVSLGFQKGHELNHLDLHSIGSWLFDTDLRSHGFMNLCLPHINWVVHAYLPASLEVYTCGFFSTLKTTNPPVSCWTLKTCWEVLDFFKQYLAKEAPERRRALGKNLWRISLGGLEGTKLGGSCCCCCCCGGDGDGGCLKVYMHMHIYLAYSIHKVGVKLLLL